MLVCLSLLQACFAAAENTVLVDAYDSLRVVANLTKPTPRHIKEANLTSRVIQDSEYPSLSNAISVSPELSQLLREEYDAIKQRFAHTTAGSGDMFAHPAAAAQFGGTTEQLDSAQRVKVELTLDSYFGHHHSSGLYIPPGELITIEIPQAAVGKISLAFNMQSRTWEGTYETNPGNTRSRLPGLRVEGLKLGNTYNTVCWPFGGFLTLSIEPDAFPEPIVITISGGILTPWFRFGVDTEEDWQNIKNYPGLVACMETSNIQMVMPAIHVRNAMNVNLAMRFLRSCAQVMESTVMKSNGNKNHHQRPNGREKVPNYWYFDNYVPAGAACAYVTLDFSCYPSNWAPGAVDGKKLMQGCWGHLHEMGHHHQDNWGIGYTGEVTNNVLVVICYAYYSTISETRYEKPNGDMGFSSNAEWKETTHPYSYSFEKGDLHQWVSLVHAFGPEKMREFIKADHDNLYYAKETYGKVEAFLLRAARIFGHDLRPHLEFMGYNLKDASQYNQTNLALLDEMNLKPWYPVANAYQTGYEVNGTTFETARPFVIPAGQKKIFNFTQYTKSRPGHGDFEIVELRGGKGQWKKLDSGVFEYTPVNDSSVLDEWRLVYREKTTGQETITYGKIKQGSSGFAYDIYLGARPASGSSPVEAYKATVGRQPNISGHGQGLKFSKGQTGNDNYVVVCRGKLIAPETGSYKFYAAPDEYVLFYLSEKPLSYNPDKDTDSLILVDDRGYGEYNLNQASKSVTLTAGKSYYFCLVIYNQFGPSGAKIGYRLNDNGLKIEEFANEAIVLADASGAEHEWIPQWEEIQGLEDYHKNSSSTANNTEFNASSVIPVTHSSFVFSKGWKSVSFGSYYNGVGKYGTKGCSLTAAYGKGVTEIVIVGDKWASKDNLASVYLNGIKIGTFSPDTKETGKIYKEPLFVISGIDNETAVDIKVVVESGEVGISGVLVKSDEKANALQTPHHTNGAVIIGIIVGCAFLAIACAAVFIAMRRARQ